ncbi:MAG: glycosyltransferase family 4 protein [Candidatus Tectimicrobiota bacterium]
MANIRLLELRNTYKWGGGPDKTILLSAAQHNRAQVETIVVYIRDVRDHEFSIAEKAHALGLTFYEIEESGKLDLRVLRALREIVVRHDINLIHGHDYKSDLFAYLLRCWMGARRFALVSTAHAWVMMGLRGALYRRLDLWLMRRFNHLIAVSQATKDEMLQAGLPSQLISVIHNAIDTREWAPCPTRPTLRTELHIAPDVPVLGYVGRIMPEKDLVTWLRAAALVGQKYPQAQFVLVGEGRDTSTLGQLQQLATELGIRERVHFPGYRSQLLPIYAAFDVFVLTSRREGLPNSVLEAMALGVPVVTTDVAGTKELVLHGQTGFVLPQGDVAGIAQAMLKLVEDTALRHGMGQASRQRVEQHFSFTGRLQRIEALYAEMVNSMRFPS